MSLPTDRFRRMNLKDIWIHDRGSLTEDIYGELTLYQKIEGSTEALLPILRADFFHTLEAEIRKLGTPGYSNDDHLGPRRRLPFRQECGEDERSHPGFSSGDLG